MKRFLLLIMTSFSVMAFAQDKPAYFIYNKDGEKVEYADMLKESSDNDILFFGELHNNPICHWLQYELTKDLSNNLSGKLVLGAEMFESDNQLIMDEFLTGVIREKSFEDEARLWPNYQTDYKPLVLLAKEKGFPFIATNIPRRYASIVHKMGFEALDSLQPEAHKYIAPLPLLYDPELSCYKNMLTMMGQMGSGHVNDNLPKAQAAKDATMAHFILENWSEEALFIHYNGDYHSANFEGIVWYVKQMNPKVKVMTISTVEQENIDNLEEENKGVADFILCVPSSMTKTH